MVFDPEDVAVAAVVFAAADDVGAAPPSDLAGEEPSEGERVGQAAVVGGGRWSAVARTVDNG